jgi:hypothetical protein
MLDNLALFGSGTNGQPLGIFATVSAFNLGGTPMTWPNFQSYRTWILITDLDPDSFAGILSPAMLSYCDSTQAYSGASYSVWEKMIDDHRDRWLVGNEISYGSSMAATTTQSGTLTNTSTSVTGLASTSGLYIGMPVSGTNVPAAATIAMINSATAITLSVAATGSGAQTLTFSSAKGLWRFVYIMTWTDGMEVQFDPYSSIDSNETVVRATILANVGITFRPAFQAIYQN